MTNNEAPIELDCLFPGCGKTAATIKNGCLEWFCRHSGDTHVNFISLTELARELSKSGYVLISLPDLLQLLSGALPLATLVERIEHSPD